MAIQGLKDLIAIKDGAVVVKDIYGLGNMMDDLIYSAVFEADAAKKEALLTLVKEIAKAAGAVPASIQGLYTEMGRNYPGFTVPAINIRGLTYDVSRALFRKALEMKAGAFIFEIARSEIGYTKQRPLEYSAVILAAAVREGYRGPIFIQGDHFQIVRKHYQSDPEPEIDYIKGLIAEAISSEFYNIDIDASTIVDLTQTAIKDQQKPNYEMTALLSRHVRSIQPEGVDVSIGGEIGEIGTSNSTPEEAQAYLTGIKETLAGVTGLSKLSVQSGTSHGGVVLPDGTLASVKIDFNTLRQLSDLARKEFGLSGCVQHGASTLPDSAFNMFPETGTSEVHLATGFQNMIFDSKHLPDEFRQEIYAYLRSEFAMEKKENQTEEQFIYGTRKKGFGQTKKKWWDLPGDVKGPIMKELEDKFGFLFDKLRVSNTADIVARTVKAVNVKKDVDASIMG
jgi:fructose/tagatose bisphosphate aldolase